MNHRSDYWVSNYILNYFGKYKSSRGYVHHKRCGMCGNLMQREFVEFDKEAVFAHIEDCHPEKLILLEEDPHNSEYTKLLNEYDKLEFDLFKLQVIESSLNGMYRGERHPRFNATLMADNQNTIMYKIGKVKEKILSYDLNHMSLIPVNNFE